MRGVAFSLFALAAPAVLAQGVGPRGSTARLQATVPSINVASDCVAKEAATEPDLLEAYTQDRMGQFLSGSIRRCWPAVSFMITEQDRLLGPGSGRAFFEGAFTRDLPQAVIVRLRPEIDRRQAEVARIEQDRKQEQERQAASIAPTMQSPPQPIPGATSPVREVYPGFRPASPPASAPAVEKQVVASERSSGGGVGWLIGILVLGLLGLAGREYLKRRRIADEEARIAEERRRRRDTLIAKYGSVEIADRIMAHDIWMAMTEEQLIESIGDPIDRSQKVLKTKTTETFKYAQTGKNRFDLRVIVENGYVVGWDTK